MNGTGIKIFITKQVFSLTTGEDLGNLVQRSLSVPKNLFENELNITIKSKVSFDINELSYDNNGDYRKIESLLLLFNVESIRNNEIITEFYPFKFHKHTHWSLEHIHAQNSESLDKTKKEQWVTWLSYHKALIEELIEDGENRASHEGLNELLDQIKLVDNEKLTWDKFSLLSNAIIRKIFEEF